MNPVLAGYSPLLVEAVTSYPAGLDFAGDRLSPDEKNVLDLADGRLFTNPNFLSSIYGPDNWPSDVKLASVQAVPLLMLAIDVQKKPDGKHVINWEVDSLDRILDELGIYEGVCTSCYGKADYDTELRVIGNHDSVVNDPRHVHRETLKTFAYFAKADGEGILIRDFMDNDADDLELLYKRDRPVYTSRTVTSFGWRNLSFMSQVKLPDGSVKSFPTQVFEIVGGAGSEREAAERWFSYVDEVMVHFSGGTESFANLYRPYSQTPYTPEPGYLLIVREAGSPSSTGLTTSAFRSLGIKAEQFFSPEKGRRTGAVELGGQWYHHNGNYPLAVRRFPGGGRTRNLSMCAFFQTLQEVEDLDRSCIESAPAVPTPIDPISPSDPPSPDRAALVALYNATGGENWTIKDNWLSDRPLGEWHGVATLEGRVTLLDLTNNDLKGELPAELGNLSRLMTLYLGWNQLTGGIPVELANLTWLAGLDLRMNQLIGEIPTAFDELSYLGVMKLAGNQLTGCAALSDRASYWVIC